MHLSCCVLQYVKRLFFNLCGSEKSNLRDYQHMPLFHFPHSHLTGYPLPTPCPQQPLQRVNFYCENTLLWVCKIYAYQFEKKKKKGRKEKGGNEGRMEGRKKVGRGGSRRWRERGRRKEGKIPRSFHLFLWWNVFNSFLQDISKVWMITMFIPEIRMNWNPSSLWELIKVKIWIKYHFLLEAQE